MLVLIMINEQFALLHQTISVIAIIVARYDHVYTLVIHGSRYKAANKVNQ